MGFPAESKNNANYQLITAAKDKLLNKILNLLIFNTVL